MVEIAQINERQITRLCHFTKGKNFTHIVNEFGGILGSDRIPSNYRDVNDDKRLDGKLNYVCCSVEYPNLYYLSSIKDNDKLFNEWIILLINPRIMTEKECLFSPVNAATESGKYINVGRVGFASLFSQVVTTSKRRIVRTEKMLKPAPTDFQAEVLIKEKVPLEYIEGIIVANEEAERTYSFLTDILGVKDKIKVIVAPELFNKTCYEKIKKGFRPKEICKELMNIGK